MTPDTQLLDPKFLGFWTRILRLSSNLSQDALATASGRTVRTIQRVEAGAPASLTTRRCLARGLGYDDPDIFDAPQFVTTVTSLLTMIADNRIEEVEARYPDHAKLKVVPLDSGLAIARLIDGADAWCFDCNDAVASETQQEAADFFDALQDYGDIWPELSHSDRFQAQESLGGLLEALISHGVGVYGVNRSSRFVPDFWADKTPLAFSISYVCVVPAGQDISHIMVPKTGRMA